MEIFGIENGWWKVEKEKKEVEKLTAGKLHDGILTFDMKKDNVLKYHRDDHINTHDIFGTKKTQPKKSFHKGGNNKKKGGKKGKKH